MRYTMFAGLGVQHILRELYTMRRGLLPALSIGFLVVTLGGCPSPVDNSTASEVSAPTFTPSGGSFSIPQDVTIVSAAQDATIYYTTDGTDPSTDNGDIYSEPVHLETTTILKAIAVTNGQPSDVVSAQFTRQHLLSISLDGSGTVTPGAGLYDEGTRLDLTPAAGDGWQFDHWEGSASGSQSPLNVTLDSDVSIKACFTITNPDLVTLDSLIVGNGSLFANPIGTPAGTGYTYTSGTSVRVTAVPANNWVFSGWYAIDGRLISTDLQMDVVLARDTYFIALFTASNPTPLPTPADCIVVAQDGQPLGVISTNAFDSDSLANPYGTYGSKYGLNSIWNELWHIR